MNVVRCANAVGALPVVQQSCCCGLTQCCSCVNLTFLKTTEGMLKLAEIKVLSKAPQKNWKPRARETETAVLATSLQPNRKNNTPAEPKTPRLNVLQIVDLCNSTAHIFL
ncbi:hypothetical protein RUM43_005669 [Polyplax serrata]|uniref:Uncharacterized protein n=1 Tax=Polyplax serrata TaxID=468196 RepID=A0AAN8NWF9_POLSC